MNISEETIDILSGDGTPSGKTAVKSLIHQKGYYHNTAHIWFYNAEGYVLLAQRSALKSIYPLLWDISVAGHVDSGETIEQAAIRETSEEIGVLINEKDLEKIGVYPCFQSYSNGIIDNEFHHTFISKIDLPLTAFTRDTNEVAALKYVSLSEFKDLLDFSKTNGHFVSSNYNYYIEVIDAINKRIL